MFATVVIVVIQTSRQLQKQTIIQATEEVVHFALSKNPQHWIRVLFFCCQSSARNKCMLKSYRNRDTLRYYGEAITDKEDMDMGKMPRMENNKW